MVRNRYPNAKQGIQWEALLFQMRMGKHYWPYWKRAGKNAFYLGAAAGACWLYNETSPLGWWTLKPRPKEEKEMAHLYERREFPYPGDAAAMEEFVAKGGMIGTTIGPKGGFDVDQDSLNFQQALQHKKFDQEAQKLWARMRNEVLADLQEKGFDVNAEE